MLACVAAVQVDHRCVFAVVPHAVHQLAERGASAGRQGVARMPQIMEVEVGKPGRFERWQPFPLPEVAMP